MTDDELDELVDEFADELGDFLGLNSHFNLTTAPTHPQKDKPKMATANPTSNMLGIELSLSEHFHATENEAAINEYSSNAAYLRREGITLSRYVLGYRKDHGDYSPMPAPLASALDKLQAAFGGVTDTKNPLVQMA